MTDLLLSELAWWPGVVWWDKSIIVNTGSRIWTPLYKITDYWPRLLPRFLAARRPRPGVNLSVVSWWLYFTNILTKYPKYPYQQKRPTLLASKLNDTKNEILFARLKGRLFLSNGCPKCPHIGKIEWHFRRAVSKEKNNKYYFVKLLELITFIWLIFHL